MYSEEQWVQYSATYTADQDTYTAVQLENLAMLPTSLLRALVPASEFTLDMLYNVHLFAKLQSNPKKYSHNLEN
jgi:hypothetical protein